MPANIRILRPCSLLFFSFSGTCQKSQVSYCWNVKTFLSSVQLSNLIFKNPICGEWRDKQIYHRLLVMGGTIESMYDDFSLKVKIGVRVWLLKEEVLFEQHKVNIELLKMHLNVEIIYCSTYFCLQDKPNTIQAWNSQAWNK